MLKKNSGWAKPAVMAAAVAGALAVSSPASAYVYATSHINVYDLILSVSGATASNLTYTFDLQNSATLNGATTSSAADCSNIGGGSPCSVVSPVLNATVVNAPGSTLLRAENNFSYNGPSAAGTFANADSVIPTAQLTQGVPTTARQIAEAQLNSNGDAQASVELQSNTNLTWTLSVGSDGATLDLLFYADPDMRVAINDEPGLFSAQSNLNASFSLTKSTGEQVDWQPQGNDTNNCNADIGTCTELYDDFDLNRNLSSGVNPVDLNYNFEAATGSSQAPGADGLYWIRITGLEAGDYSIALNLSTSVNIRRDVPEPGILALLGIGLAGIAATRVRRSRRTAR